MNRIILEGGAYWQCDYCHTCYRKTVEYMRKHMNVCKDNPDNKSKCDSCKHRYSPENKYIPDKCRIVDKLKEEEKDFGTLEVSKHILLAYLLNVIDGKYNKCTKHEDS